MCIISFDKEALNITISNLHPDLELTSPVYFSNGTICHVSPSQKTDIDTVMKYSFETAFKQEDFKGILLYKLQGKYVNRTDNQPNSSTESIESTTTNVYLLAIWDIKNYDHGFHVCLMECVDDFTWDEDKLWALHDQYKYQFPKDYTFNISTWLMNDNTMMKIRHDVTYGSDYKLDIVISEGTEKYNMDKPVEIVPERLVLSL
jgi:hypothetical protein